MKLEILDIQTRAANLNRVISKHLHTPYPGEIKVYSDETMVIARLLEDISNVLVDLDNRLSPPDTGISYVHTTVNDDGISFFHSQTITDPGNNHSVKRPIEAVIDQINAIDEALVKCNDRIEGLYARRRALVEEGHRIYSAIKDEG